MTIETKKAKNRLHDMNVSAVRIVPKGANARNGWLICKSADPENTSTETDRPDQETRVEKAVTLVAGESVQQFLSAIRDSFKAHVNPSGDYEQNQWICDIYESHFVADKNENGITKYYQYSWLRNADGTFTFGEPIEVVHVTSYVVKTDENQIPTMPALKISSRNTETTDPANSDTTTEQTEKEALELQAKTEAEAEAVAEQTRKDSMKTLKRLQSVLRNHVHAVVDEALVATPQEPEVDPATVETEPAAKVAKVAQIPQGARSNALTAKETIAKSFEWHPGDLNELEIE